MSRFLFPSEYGYLLTETHEEINFINLDLPRSGHTDYIEKDAKPLLNLLNCIHAIETNGESSEEIINLAEIIFLSEQITK